MKHHRLLISFTGPSGAGKSTCYKYAENLLRLGYQVHQLDVARPLRLVQNYAYGIFDKDSPGDPDDPINFKQDGALLSFLAKHFENVLGAYFLKKFTTITAMEKTSVQPMAIINTDCRNNLYDLLDSLGFVFVGLEVRPDILTNRRATRGDLSPYDEQKSVEQYDRIKTSHTISNNGTLEELEKQVHDIILKIIH